MLSSSSIVEAVIIGFFLLVFFFFGGTADDFCPSDEGYAVVLVICFISSDVLFVNIVVADISISFDIIFVVAVALGLLLKPWTVKDAFLFVSFSLVTSVADADDVDDKDER